MWAAPVLFPHIKDPSQSYAILSDHLLPTGFVGLVVAGLMSHTMAMTSSDANAISAVVTRDILPAVWRRARTLHAAGELAVARVVTVLFMAASMVLAAEADKFGGVLGLIITWFGALIGPISIPMLLGMLPAFRRSGSTAAIVSWAAGLGAFGVVNYGLAAGVATTVAVPVLVAPP
jgi:SSS family solute:Na+ symporter